MVSSNLGIGSLNSDKEETDVYRILFHLFRKKSYFQNDPRSHISFVVLEHVKHDNRLIKNNNNNKFRVKGKIVKNATSKGLKFNTTYTEMERSKRVSIEKGQANLNSLRLLLLLSFLLLQV